MKSAKEKCSPGTINPLTVTVAGTGYVGLSIAILLSQHHRVYAVDILEEKIEKINRRISPIQDEYIEKYLGEKELDLTATLDAGEAYAKADFIVIAAPTNYDSVTHYFDTSAVVIVLDLEKYLFMFPVIFTLAALMNGLMAFKRYKMAERIRMLFLLIAFALLVALSVVGFIVTL